MIWWAFFFYRSIIHKWIKENLKMCYQKNMSNILNSVYIQSLYVEVVGFGPIEKKSKDRVILFAV